MRSEIVDVAPVSLERVAEVIASIGHLVDVILEDLISTQEGLQLVTVGVLVHAYTAGDEVLGLEGTVGHHREDINYVMGQTVGAVVAAFPPVVHLELTSGHLGDAVVHGLAGVDGRLEVGVLQGKHAATGFSSFVSGANVEEDADVDVGGDGD